MVAALFYCLTISDKTTDSNQGDYSAAQRASPKSPLRDTVVGEGGLYSQERLCYIQGLSALVEEGALKMMEIAISLVCISRWRIEAWPIADREDSR